MKIDWIGTALKLVLAIAQWWNTTRAKKSGKDEAIVQGKASAEKEEALAKEVGLEPVDPDEPDEFMRKD